MYTAKLLCCNTTGRHRGSEEWQSLNMIGIYSIIQYSIQAKMTGCYAQSVRCCHVSNHSGTGLMHVLAIGGTPPGHISNADHDPSATDQISSPARIGKSHSSDCFPHDIPACAVCGYIHGTLVNSSYTNHPTRRHTYAHMYLLRIGNQTSAPHLRYCGSGGERISTHICRPRALIMLACNVHLEALHHQWSC
jgi:hypothetical protein